MGNTSKKARFVEAGGELPEDARWMEDILSAFPKTFHLVCHADDNSSVTAVYDKDQRNNVVEALRNIAPGCKLRYESDNQGKNNLRNLGSIRPGSLPGHHKLKTSLPPCTFLQTYCCVHRDLNRHKKKVARASDMTEEEAEGAACESLNNRENEREPSRFTHILKDGECSCDFEARIRDLQCANGAEYVALTFARGSHVHSCPTAKLTRHR